MGMMIEEAIKELKHIKALQCVLNEENIIALELAIATMRKYQKIVGIVSLNDEEFKQCGLKELKEILEVIADENVD